jgi:hypothetical protein
MGPNPLLTTVQEIAIGLGIGFVLPAQFVLDWCASH